MGAGALPLFPDVRPFLVGFIDALPFLVDFIGAQPCSAPFVDFEIGTDDLSYPCLSLLKL
jgi:hypothetical protein